jgi:predicted amidophosphoribosyltransferase
METTRFISACDEISMLKSSHFAKIKTSGEGWCKMCKSMLDRSWSKVEESYETLSQSERLSQAEKLIHATKFQETQTLYMTLGAAILDQITKYNKPNFEEMSFLNNPHAISEQKDIRLPAIKINRFNGDYRN